MKIGVLGSGFGLYGYLPALVRNGYRNILLPARYKDILRARSEINALKEFVDWQESEHLVIQNSQALFCIKRPIDQYHLIKTGINFDLTKFLFLEKPLAPSPELAAETLATLITNGCIVQTGHFFAQTSWAQRLQNLLAQKGQLRRVALTWTFTAHHYQTGLDTWKRTISEGGGALRFYGIHLIALLAQLGFQTVRESAIQSKINDEAESWSASFAHSDGRMFDVEVHSNQPANIFRIKCDQKPFVDLTDPFQEEPKTDLLDSRVPLLSHQIATLLKNNLDGKQGLEKTINLWADVEKMTGIQR